jgi:hypothetical protein
MGTPELFRVSGDWFSDEHVTVDSATCIDISIVSFLNK